MQDNSLANAERLEKILQDNSVTKCQRNKRKLSKKILKRNFAKKRKERVV